MASIKINRISEDIRKELTGILREVKDPRVSKMLSIIKVDLSNDLSHCKVFVSAIEGVDKTVESVEGLKSASGYIRREVSMRLHLRKTPQFHFIADDSIAYSANINQILAKERSMHPEWDLEDEEEDEDTDF